MRGFLSRDSSALIAMGSVVVEESKERRADAACGDAGGDAGGEGASM